MILAATGHRPRKLGGYGDDVRRRLVELAWTSLARERPEKVISGMALGWDQAVATAAVGLGIPFVAAVPCDGQEVRWPMFTHGAYLSLLRQAAEVVVVSRGGYAAWKMDVRNRWMVDRCDRLLALWDGGPIGGTAACLRYADRVGRPWTNVWNEWQEPDR